ncbi:hypothetical protein AB3S75_033813 [Citrus x aurantiifolia]
MTFTVRETVDFLPVVRVLVAEKRL